MPANIYDQHKAAFSQVSAFIVLGRDTDDIGNPVRVATVALKYPKDGAGRLYAYIHWLGFPMVRGFATGGGYDKATAACASAAWLLNLNELCETGDTGQCRSFVNALRLDGGATWDRALRDAGFTVLQAV